MQFSKIATQSLNTPCHGEQSAIHYEYVIRMRIRLQNRNRETRRQKKNEVCKQIKPLSSLSRCPALPSLRCERCHHVQGVESQFLLPQPCRLPLFGGVACSEGIPYLVKQGDPSKSTPSEANRGDILFSHFQTRAGSQ